MKNLVKLVVISVFGLGALFTFLSSFELSGLESGVSAQARPTPTPPKAANAVTANTAAPSNANAVKPPTPAAGTGGKTMKKEVLLDQDGSEGAVPFNHDTHAFKNYSIDGKSVIACVECHHSDQPKSAMKPPLVTSERDVVLTFDVWKASAQKVSECRACHFVPTDIPEGKEMPTLTYTERGKSVTKDLSAEFAYHKNCNECHDSAAKARPELKSRPGFATGTDCKTCHSK